MLKETDTIVALFYTPLRCVGGGVCLQPDVLLRLFLVGVGPDRWMAWCVCLLMSSEAFPNMTGWHGNYCILLREKISTVRIENEHSCGSISPSKAGHERM